MLQIIVIFALSLISIATGVLGTLWIQHVARTGCHPLPSAPTIETFRRAFGRNGDDDDDDEPAQPPPRQRVGP